MPCRKGLRPGVASRKGSRHRDSRERGASEVRSVTVGALVLIALSVLAMLAHPTFIDIVHSVRAAVERFWSALVTYGAFNDLSCMTLQIGAVDIVVRLQAGILCVLRTMAPGAVKASMSRAEPEEVLADRRFVQGSGKGVVGRGAPSPVRIEG